MSEPNKVISCQGCLQRLNTRSYVFGHAQCSYHRKCTGGMFWEPRGCPQCNTCLHRMANMTVSQVRDFLTNYRRMLQGVKNKLRRDNPARVWEYECVFPYFFKEYIHFDLVLSRSPIRYIGDLVIGVFFLIGYLYLI